MQTLTKPPQRRKIDLERIEWRTLVMIQAGIDPEEAARIALLSLTVPPPPENEPSKMFRP